MSDNDKYTSGPWAVSKQERADVNAKHAANVNLIEAAPYLLRACERFIVKCDYMSISQTSDTCAEMRAAIAKANGEPK